MNEDLKLPWTVVEDESGYRIEDAERSVVCEESLSNPSGTDKVYEQMRHIVAAVNATAHLSAEQLERLAENPGAVAVVLGDSGRTEWRQ